MPRISCTPCIPLGLVLLLQTVCVFAQTDDDDLALMYDAKSTVSIATGNQQSLRRAPAVATVITVEDIAAMGATDLDAVLETVPGMHVARSALEYEPIYAIRGIYSVANPQILVLQNGVPMTTLFTGSRGNIWGGYPLEHIARIEVIRGPGSALYGADAYSGVINIITKTASDTPGTQFGGRVGSFNTRDAWVQHGGTLGPVEVAAYLRLGRTDGFKSIISADAQSARDKTFGTSASLAPGPVNVGNDAVDANIDFSLEKWRLRGGYKLRDNLGTGAGTASALDPVGRAKSERITSDLSWTDTQFAKDWGLGFAGSYLGYKQRIPTDLQLSPPGSTFPTGTFPNGMIGHPDTSERQIRLSGFTTYSGFADHSIRLGLGHDDLNLYETATYKNYVLSAAGVPIPAGPVADYSETQPFMLPQHRRVDYVYAQDEWQFARDWALTAGVRNDRYSDFGETTNPRVALVWDATLDLTAKLLYGQAFRAPSFNEDYGINNPVLRGNPNLTPEKIKTLEAVLAWQARKDLQVNVNFFAYTMEQVIRAVANTAPGTGSTYGNTGSQTGRGAELEMVWDASRSLRLSGNYAYQSSTDDATGQDAGYTPHNHLYARADWRIAEAWLLSPQLNWVSNRERAFGDTRPKIADYQTVDLTLRNSRKQWDFTASIRNLCDADVREPSLAPGAALSNDLPMAGRSVYVQLVYKM